MIIDCLNIFLEIITGILPMIGKIITVCITRKEKRQLINLLYRTAGKENERKNILDFYSYINHRLSSTLLDSSQVSDYSIKRLKKELKPNASCNQMTFILGDPGSGKSTLMLHLAYWYCRHNNLRKEISPNENLKNWGILYCRMRDYQTLEALKEKLEDNLDAVFLDGFDEFVVLQNESEETVLEELLGILLNNSNAFRKIYISSRKEPFKSNLKKILYEMNLDGHQPLIIEICPFNRKQILSLYKKKGKRGNVHKMRRYLSDNETIFRIPLFIEYADVIIKDYSDNVSLSLWQALNSIVKDWMEKEEQLWYSRQEVGKKRDKKKKDVYYQDAWKFILKLCKNMIQTGVYSFSIAEIEESFWHLKDMYYESKNRKFFFSTRQLIHKKNEKEYEFIHSLFFEFFVARLLVSLESTTFEQKKQLLIDDTSNYYEFYVQWLQAVPATVFGENMPEVSLLQELKQSIDGYVSYDVDKSSIDTVEQIQELISADCISLKEEAEITVYDILWIFPLVGEIKWKSYQLSLPEITDLMESGKLSLIDGRLKSLSDLQYFSPFKNLDIRNNNIIDLEEMPRYDSFDYLCLYGNRLESLVPLENTEISKLELSIWNEKNLEELNSLSVGSYGIDLPEVSSLYIKLEQLENPKIHWCLAFPPKIAAFRKCYNKLPCEIFMNQILEAAFRLTVTFFCTEKHFESAAFDLGEEAGKCFYLRKKYEESLEVFKRLESAVEKAEDAEERFLLKTRGWIGQIFAKTGEYERAIPLLERACGGHWKDDADIETKIMWYWLLKSLDHEKRKINVQDYGINDIFEVMFLWGKTLSEDGQFDEAENVLRVLYQRQSESMGEKNRKSLETQHWLGAAFHKDGQYKEAERELNECLEKRIEVLGEKDKDSLNTQLWLGATLYQEKKYKEAESVLRGCYEKREEILGEKAEDTLTAQSWLGQNLKQEKKYEEAEKMLRACHEKREEVLGEKAEDTLMAQHYLGETLYGDGKYEEAERELNECLEKRIEVLGEKHKDSLNTQLWLGATLYLEKKYKEAEGVLRACHEKREEVLGEKAEDTLTAQSWLGRNLKQEKKYEEAEKMLRDCYKKQKEVLGETDSETLYTKKNLEAVLQRIGN